MGKAQSGQFLFVVGCPRSGTTAMGMFLAEDSKVAMGIERYGHRMFFGNFTITPELFEKERFMTIEDGDTFYDSFDFSKNAYAGIEEKLDNALWVGDKIPKLYETLEDLFDTFPDNTKVIFIFRNIFDVCASYNKRLNDPQDNWKYGTAAAIKDWNNSIAAYKRSKHKDKIIPIVFEEFFHDEEKYLKLCEILDIPVNDETAERVQRFVSRNAQLEEGRNRALSERDVFQITTDALFGGYREIVSIYRELFSGDHPKAG
tara:strand:+ start:131 stop:907 length:777 start_codon:yes stop_codon:yes gene_type:complete